MEDFSRCSIFLWKLCNVLRNDIPYKSLGIIFFQADRTLSFITIIPADLDHSRSPFVCQTLQPYCRKQFSSISDSFEIKYHPDVAIYRSQVRSQIWGRYQSILNDQRMTLLIHQVVWQNKCTLCKNQWILTEARFLIISSIWASIFLDLFKNTWIHDDAPKINFVPLELFLKKECIILEIQTHARRIGEDTFQPASTASHMVLSIFF